MDWTKTTARQDEKHLSFGIWCDLYKRFYSNQCFTSITTVQYWMQPVMEHGLCGTNITVKPAWWLLMAWHLVGARTFATIIMIYRGGQLSHICIYVVTKLKTKLKFEFNIYIYIYIIWDSWPTLYIIMMVADVLASNRCQAISNQHADLAVMSVPQNIHVALQPWVKLHLIAAIKTHLFVYQTDCMRNLTVTRYECFPKRQCLDPYLNHRSCRDHDKNAVS